MCLHTFIDCTNGNLKVVQEGNLRKAFLRQQIKNNLFYDSDIKTRAHLFYFISVFMCSGYQDSKIWSDNEGNENLIFIQLLDFIYQRNIHNSGVINYSFHFLWMICKTWKKNWEYVKNIQAMNIYQILQLWLSEKAYCSIYMFVCFLNIVTDLLKCFGCICKWLYFLFVLLFMCLVRFVLKYYF